MSKTRILLGRHPESEGNKDDNAYKKGDRNIMPTPLGWKQSLHMGRFLGQYYQKTGTKEWPTIYLSDYNRVLGGFRGALTGGLSAAFNNTEPKLNTDPRLVEKFFGALTELTNPEGSDDPEFFKKIVALSKRIRERDPHMAATLFGESDQMLYTRIKAFADGSLYHDKQDGQNDFFIYAHGATTKAFIAAYSHAMQSQYNEIEIPGNCDIIEITGEKGSWNIRKIYNGETMKPANDPVVDHIKRLTVADLPEVPADILQQFHQDIAPSND